MGLSMHVRRGHPITFGLMIFFGIIDGAIAAWLTHRYRKRHDWLSISVRDRTYLLLFTSWWTVLGSAILLALFMRSSASKLASVLVHLVFLGITWVFWTAGAASITASMGGGINCSRVAQQVVYCNQLNALMGFSWVNWVLATFAIFVVIICAVRSARRGDGTRGALVVD
ncbi:membrane-associating domain protein [Rhizoctonia solani 123E]|uniref:Membrane-associating domain protein n=1 Tax=Rhizoctonia solani 123E TaxID=1423351 RepID=A0A074S946_9AGAM|nr:membrane-associating domain protein [Rhizoctonia solani 123E]